MSAETKNDLDIQVGDIIELRRGSVGRPGHTVHVLTAMDAADARGDNGTIGLTRATQIDPFAWGSITVDRPSDVPDVVLLQAGAFAVEIGDGYWQVFGLEHAPETLMWDELAPYGPTPAHVLAKLH